MTPIRPLIARSSRPPSGRYATLGPGRIGSCPQINFAATSATDHIALENTDLGDGSPHIDIAARLASSAEAGMLMCAS